MKTNIDWDKFKIFYYVAKAGNITHAANFLNVSQPALSRSIQLLENSMEIQLFERLPRGLALTRQGEELFESVTKVFNELSRIETVIQEKEEELQGTLKVATTMAMASVGLVHDLSDFMKSHPKLRLIIIGSDETLEIKTHKADVSIRPYVQGYPDLIQEYIFSVHLKLYASKEYLEKFGRPETSGDLNYHPLIVFGDEVVHPYGNVNWPLTIGMPGGEVREPYFCVNSSQGMRQAAEDGLGIVALSAEYVRVVKSDLVEVLPELDKPEIPLYYVYPEHLSASKRVKVFGEYVKKKIAKTNEFI